jgi:hypothetical protein
MSPKSTIISTQTIPYRKQHKITQSCTNNPKSTHLYSKSNAQFKKETQISGIKRSESGRKRTQNLQKNMRKRLVTKKQADRRFLFLFSKKNERTGVFCAQTECLCSIDCALA